MQVAIYCRLSKEDRVKEDESESIKNQKKLLTAYALQNDWEIVQYYVDEDYKGSDRDRPEFKRLLKDAQQNKFQIILCKSQARFCRDLELIEKYLHGKFLEWGIRFVSIVDRADTSDKANKKSRQIIGLKDEWYLEDLSDDIRRVLNQKRKEGMYIATWALYGYQKDPDQKGHLILDPVVADVVKDIYAMYMDGFGMQKIARVLNDRQIDSPYVFKIKKGMTLNKKNITPKASYWSVGAIYSILTNQTYTGDLVQGKMKKISYKSKKLVRTPSEEWFIVPNTHEAIISKEDFQKVQEIRTAKGRPIKSGKRHIFSGKVYCLECGQIMSAGRYPKVSKKNPQQKEYVGYLKCSSRIVRMESCIGATILMRNLEDYIMTEINRLADLYFSGDEIAKKAVLDQKQKEEQELAKTAKLLRSLEKNIELADNALKDLYMDKVQGIISEEEFIRLKHSLSEENSDSKAEYERVKEKISFLEKKIKQKQDRKSIIGNYRKIDALNREVLDELIERIYVGHKDSKTKERTIKIVWAI